jgi:hypothetical protein
MRTVGLFVCVLLVSASTAAADVIAEWNATTLTAVAAGARRGPSGQMDVALVNVAMYDAVQAFENRFEPYCGSIPGATGSPSAAAARAAHMVLVALFPAQTATLDAAYAVSVGKYGTAGAAVGEQAALCVLARLPADNIQRAKPDTFVGGTAPGDWRPTTLSPTGAPVPIVAEFIATFTPFAIRNPDDYRAAVHPPFLHSGAYVKAYNEVKALGRADPGSSRTDEQTKMARFFADNAVAYWNRGLQGLVDSQSLSIGDSARMFALVSIAVADSMITAWDSKIAWNFWRPITAIRNDDGNPLTEADPTWTPLVATPNYPAYTSGATNLAGAATEMLKNFFGADKVNLTLTSITIPAPDNVRHYSRFSDAAKDVVDARIYDGIHFRFDDEVARRQGQAIANWIFSHLMRPIGGGRD